MKIGKSQVSGANAWLTASEANLIENNSIQPSSSSSQGSKKAQSTGNIPDVGKISQIGKEIILFNFK